MVDDAIVVIENIERHIHEGERDPHKAASAAMGEVPGAVIATSLVLVAVFVPVAFFPGTTGILFRQFALTIAFSIAISAFNALTLTPALSALLLREDDTRERTGSSAVSNRRDRGGHRRIYVDALRAFLNCAGWSRSLLFFAGLGLTYWCSRRVPTGFVPDEDQGYFIVVVQAPQGASLDYTKAIGKQVDRIMQKIRRSKARFAIAGFSFGGGAPNRGMIFVPLKPYSQRKGDAAARRRS